MVTDRDIGPLDAAPRANWTWNRGLALVVGVAFACRLTAVLWLRDTVPFTDFLLYHVAAQQIAYDALFPFRQASLEIIPQFNWWPPVYPWFLGSIYGFLGVDHRLAVFAQVLLGTLTVWFVYRIAAIAAGRRVALVAGLLVAVAPTYVFATNQLASENLLVFFVAWGVWLMLTGCSWRTQLGAGVVLGLGTLTRAVGGVIPLLAIPWHLRGTRPARQPLLRALCLAAGVALPILPWAARNVVRVGTFQPVCYGGGLNFYFGHNPEGIGFRPLVQTPLRDLHTPSDIDTEGYRLGFEYIARDPVALLPRTWSKLRSYFGSPFWALHINSGILVPNVRDRPDLMDDARSRFDRQRARDRLLHGPFRAYAWAFHWFVCLGALIALLRWRQQSTTARWLVGVSLAWLVVHLVFWATPRYRYPAEMFLAILAATSWTWLLDLGRRRRISHESAPTQD